MIVSGSVPEPQLLVSVRNLAEATAAAAGGATWIDLKEPTRGALGPVDLDTASAVATWLNGRATLSAAGGEWREWRSGAGRRLLALSGLDWIKVGLAASLPESRFKVAQTGAQRSCADFLTALGAIRDEATAAGKNLVLATYADYRAAGAVPPDAAISLARNLGVQWLLIDTFDKRGPSLLEWMPHAKLASWLAACHAAGLRTAVAGRLSADDFVSLPWDLIDVVGVRGAACGGDRLAGIDPEAVRRLATSCHQLCAAPPSPRNRRREPAIVVSTPQSG